MSGFVLRVQALASLMQMFVVRHIFFYSVVQNRKMLPLQIQFHQEKNYFKNVIS